MRIFGTIAFLVLIGFIGAGKADAQLYCACVTAQGEAFKTYLPTQRLNANAPPPRVVASCNSLCAKVQGATSTGRVTSDPKVPLWPLWANWNQTTGGNCQGNDWCQRPLDVIVSNKAPSVGEEVTAKLDRFAPGGFNLGSVDGRYRSVVNPPVGYIEWGDGASDKVSPLPGFAPKHVYKRAGPYTIRAYVQGEFHWNGEGASCSYKCNVVGNEITITVK
jgi:hypothetical protein